MPAVSQRQAVDFEAYVARATSEFTGREWLFEVIDTWLRSADAAPYFLLTGEPGSGKSAIAGRLWQISRGLAPAFSPSLSTGAVSAAYFCAAPGAGDRRWINPATFATSISLQLAARYPAFATALVEVSDSRRVQIQITQNIHAVHGTAIGLEVQRLNFGGLSAEEAFTYAVREPLETVCSAQLEQPVLILVDALDESLQFTGRITIAQLLSQAESLPRQVRLFVTCRPDMDLLPIDKVYVCSVTGAYERARTMADIRRYIERSVDSVDGGVRRKLSTGLTAEEFTRAAEVKSNGNFLYIRKLLEMLSLQSGPITRATVDAFPDGLDGIYMEYLRRLSDDSARGPAAWSRELASFLGSLAVAQETLSEAQLASFAHLPRDRLRRRRVSIGWLLDSDTKLPPTRRTFALFHRSLAEFLLDADRAGRFWLDERELHQRMVRWCEEDRGIEQGKIWKTDRDDPAEDGRRQYARRHYVAHLLLASAWERLERVLDDGVYGRAKVREDPTTLMYAQDLDLGRRAAARQTDSLVESMQLLDNLWRYSLLRCSLASAANDYPEDYYRALTKLGRESEAVDLADLVTDSSARAHALCGIAEVLSERDGQSVQAVSLLDRAHAIASTAARSSASDWGALQSVATVMARVGMTDEAIALVRELEADHEPVYARVAIAEAYARAQKLDAALVTARGVVGGWGQAEALCGVARILISEGVPDAAAQVLDEAHAVARSTEFARSQADALVTVADTLLLTDRAPMASRVLEEASEASQRIVEADLAEWSRSRIARVIGTSGRFEEALAVVPTISNGDWRALLLRTIARALTLAGRVNEALSLADRVNGAFDEIGERAVTLIAISESLVRTGNIERAVAILDDALASLQADQMQDARTYERSRIALTLLAADQRDRAVTVLEETRRVVRTPRDMNERVDVQATLIEELLRRDDQQAADRLITDSLRLASDARHWGRRNLALTRLVVCLANGGRAGQAEELARVIASYLETDSSTASEVAAALAGAGSVQYAESLANQFHTDRQWQRDDIFAAVTGALIDSGHLDDAGRMTGYIDATYKRGEMLVRLGRAAARAAHQEVIEAAVRTLLDPREDTMLELVELARAFVAMGGGMNDIAVRMLRSAYATARTIEAMEWRADRLGLIASALVDAGELEFAKSVACESLETLRRVDTPDAWATVLGEVVTGLRDAGAGDAALAYVEERAQSTELHDTELRAIAVAYGHLSRPVEAAATVDRIGSASSEQREAVTRVAHALATSGAYGAAVTLVRSRHGSVQELIEHHADLGHLELASAMAPEIERVDRSVYVLGKLVHALIAAGADSAVAPVLNLMMTIVDEVAEHDHDGREFALARASEALSAAGRLNEAYSTLRRVHSDTYRENALKEYAAAVGRLADQEEALQHIHRAWSGAATRNELQLLLPMARSSIALRPQLAVQFADAYAWVEDFLRS
jgi:tetratricopeptide (TPR) repeat protein